MAFKLPAPHKSIRKAQIIISERRIGSLKYFGATYQTIYCMKLEDDRTTDWYDSVLDLSFAASKLVDHPITESDIKALIERQYVKAK